MPAATSTPELVHLGQRIRTLRAKTGLSQEALAAAAGIHRTYMSALERGVYNPTFTTLRKLARALRVHPGKLFDE